MGRELYRSEYSKGMSCFADAQMDIIISSSICADVVSEVYKLDYIFQVLLRLMEIRKSMGHSRQPSRTPVFIRRVSESFPFEMT